MPRGNPTAADAAAQAGSSRAGRTARWRQSALVAVPVLLLVAFCLPVFLHNHVANYDEAMHLDCARSILRTGLPIRRIAGGQVYLNHPPLYLYILALHQALWRAGELSGRLLNTLCAVGVVAGAWLLTDLLRAPRDRGRLIGPLAAASLVAVHPLVIRLGSSVGFEMMLTLWITAALLCYLVAERRDSKRLYVLTGVLLGLALLTKALALLLLVSLGLYWLLRHGWRAFCMPGPYLVSGTALAIFALWFVFGLLADRALFMLSLHRWVGQGAIVHDPRTGLGWGVWLRQLVTGGLGLVFSALVAVAWLRAALGYRQAPQRALLALYVAVGVGASFLMSIKEVRHQLPLIVPMAVLAALALDEGAAWLGRHVRHAGALCWLGLAVILWVVAPVQFPLAESAEDHAWFTSAYRARAWEADRGDLALRRMGEWLGEHTPPDIALTTVRSGTVVGYYADRPYELLYVNDAAGVMMLLRESRIVVVDEPIAGEVALPGLSSEEREAAAALLAERYRPLHELTVGSRRVEAYEAPAGPGEH